MAKKLSSGLLLYRWSKEHLELLIAHMGGPFWAHRDEGAWSIPKGECVDGEDSFAAAVREFEEELGAAPQAETYVDLGAFTQHSGKVVRVWTAEAEFDPKTCKSNTFEMEWPRGSGRIIDVPEVDRVEWCRPSLARSRLVRGQDKIVDAVVLHLGGDDRSH